jgi:hypothetical protein
MVDVVSVLGGQVVAEIRFLELNVALYCGFQRLNP